MKYEKAVEWKISCVARKWIDQCFEKWEFQDPKQQQQEQFKKDVKSYETAKLFKNINSPKKQEITLPLIPSSAKRERLNRRSSSTNTFSACSIQNFENTHLFVQKRKRDENIKKIQKKTKKNRKTEKISDNYLDLVDDDGDDHVDDELLDENPLFQLNEKDLEDQDFKFDKKTSKKVNFFIFSYLYLFLYLYFYIYLFLLFLFIFILFFIYFYF